MALVQFYDNFVIVVGNTWGSGKCSYQYGISPIEIPIVMAAVERGTVADWVKRKAGDFETVLDYHLECEYITIGFKDEANEELVEEHDYH